MRTFKQIVFALFLGLILSSCVLSFGVETGDVYIAYFWYTSDSITIQSDNNPYLPSPFLNNQYYKAGPGTYEGRYKVGNDYFDYKYKLWVDFSEDTLAELDDAYFQLWLSPSGPIFYDRTFDGSPKDIKASSGETAYKGVGAALAPDADAPPSGSMEVSRNGYHIQLEYWKSEE